ncbi:MAG: helix-hairpin-helix domain-containing protein, partial [Bacteroidia bacterium]
PFAIRAMKQFLRDYFTFNRRERNGVFILLSIILLLILYLSFSDLFFSKDKIDFSKFEKEISSFQDEQKKMNDSSDNAQINYFTSSNSPDTDSVERFDFNPNNLPDEDWKRLGLSEKQIKVIKNYESKGGKFRGKEDVKKMYCIRPNLYASLEPYIQIPKENRSEAKIPIAIGTKPEKTQTFKKEIVLIELNSADTTELKKIKGIGSVFAKRIVKFRDLLGGFVKKEQLMEVYGFDQEKFDLVSPQTMLDSSSVKKININTVSFEALKQHPYIKYNIANLIINYRKQHGNYRSVTDIKHLNLVDEKLYSKIAPYLTVQ